MIEGPSTRECKPGCCLGCGFPTKLGVGEDSEYWCGACILGIPIYDINFRTEFDARLAWMVLQELLHGSEERRHRRFPGDPVPAPKASLSNITGKGDISSKLKQLDLLVYASHRTEMQAAGANSWRGRCPIHDEKTASFYVWADPWRWRCFGGCAMGGDIIDLARELRKRPAANG